MGGYFGAISHRDVGLDVFFGTDYHSHLGTRRGGMVVYGPETGFVREIHDIENTPFRTKFESALHEFKGHIGMGCISDTDPQPLLVRSHLGLYAICTVGIINNIDELIDTYFSDHGHQFMAQSSGKVNVSELPRLIPPAVVDDSRATNLVFIFCEFKSFLLLENGARKYVFPIRPGTVFS